jgi:ABC-type antimicrobial peptide transport system permease subunit
VITGVKVAEGFAECDLGETLNFGARDWNVVGVFEAGGGGFESEIWSDYQQIADAFSRPIYSSMTFTLKYEAMFSEMKSRIDADPRFNLDVQREKDYYAKQSENTRLFIEALGITISIIFSLGAIVGAMITMYAAVANRTVEIGTMRALGFRRRTILTTFLIESIMISLIGGGIGLGGAYFMRFVEVSTTNWDTFAELAFSFEISIDIVINALIFALVMGVVGGFLPAVRASRLRIINALRGN